MSKYSDMTNKQCLAVLDDIERLQYRLPNTAGWAEQWDQLEEMWLDIAQVLESRGVEVE